MYCINGFEQCSTVMVSMWNNFWHDTTGCKIKIAVSKLFSYYSCMTTCNSKNVVLVKILWEGVKFIMSISSHCMNAFHHCIHKIAY